MVKKILYVVGNGFDLHHDIKSSYLDFREFIVSKDEALVKLLERNFDADTLWSNFEAALAEENFFDVAVNYLTPYSSDDWSDDDNHVMQRVLDGVIQAATVKLKTYFTEWILQLSIPNKPGDAKLTLAKNGTFLNFNYTPTLEKAYGIRNKNIFYVHNQALHTQSNLILGHGKNPVARPPITQDEDELEDSRILQAIQAIDDYYATTYKSTQKIIGDNKAFFTALSDVDEIHVLGHSLSPVDLPYFEEICRNIDITRVKWKVSCYNAEALANNQQVLKNLGVHSGLITFDTMAKLYNMSTPIL